MDHSTHVPGPVAQSSAESEYNGACMSGMALAHFRMIKNELEGKDTDKVPKEPPLIVMDSKSRWTWPRMVRTQNTPGTLPDVFTL